MAKPWKSLRDKMSPASRQRSAAKAKQYIDDLLCQKPFVSVAYGGYKTPCTKMKGHKGKCGFGIKPL